MGGCNSTLNDIELAGAVIGAGVATAASGGAAAAGAVAAVGSAGAYFATKSGCSRDRKAIINASNQIVATAILQSLNYCTQVADTWQSINITCNPVMPAGEVYEGNKACGTCVEDVFLGMLNQHQLERKQWDRETPTDIGVRLDINSEYTLLMGRVGTCGLVSCKACTLANVSQNNILTVDSSCYSTLTNTTFFQANLSSLVQQQLLNNQDVLAGVAKAFGNNDVSTLTEDITNRISSQVNENFLQEFVNQLKSTQIININSTGSFSGNGIAQINIFQLATQYVQDQSVITNSLPSEMFTMIEQVANEQNTLNDVGTLTFEATVGFTAALSNVVGQVMIATLALLGVVVVAIVAYAGYKFIRKTSQAAAQVASEVELTRLQKAALVEF